MFSHIQFYLRKILSFAISKPACQIKEFNLQTEEVVVYCYGFRIITIKSNIVDIIGDANIVVNLPADQACLLGYYYGKLSHQTANRNFSHSRGDSFLLRFTKGRLKIFSIDRNNMLTYVDTKSNKIYKESPLAMVQNQFLINQFDSSQACYIGIQAGLMVAKQGEQVLSVNKKPIFTLIK